MKRIIKWLSRDTPKHSITSDADQRDIGSRPKQKAEGEHSDNSCFSWFGIDNADSSIFDTVRLVTEKSADKDAVSHSTLRLEDDPLFSAEEDLGVDPYNTGRFNTANK